jgi:tryptophan-rich sensory protein
MIKRQHENVVCVCEKISRRKQDFSVFGVVFSVVFSVVFLCIQKAATHDITHCNITEGMFQLSSFYIIYFSCNYFFSEIMTEGAADP